MSTSIRPDGSKRREVYSTLTLDSEAREVAMRKDFVKAGRWLVRNGHNLNSLLKQIDRGGDHDQ